MEKHFLAELVDGEPGFIRGPWYNPFGDCLVVALVDEARVADRIDEVLTIYRSAIDDRPIGFQIKGVAALIKRFGLDGLSVESVGSDDELVSVSVSGLLLTAYQNGPNNIHRRQAYSMALDQFSPPAHIRKSELLSV